MSSFVLVYQIESQETLGGVWLWDDFKGHDDLFQALVKLGNKRILGWFEERTNSTNSSWLLYRMLMLGVNRYELSFSSVFFLVSCSVSVKFTEWKTFHQFSS